MSKVIFDIEANGLEPTKVWCIAAKVYGQSWDAKFFGPDQIHNFYDWLMYVKADTLIGHNIIGYDLPVLMKLTKFIWQGKIEDTLVMSRLDNPSREGGHSLESWGQRMNFPKQDFHDFDNYSEKMKEYCINDVDVTYRIYDMLSKTNLSKDALKLEHHTAEIIQQQKDNGWLFNSQKATVLLAELKQEMVNAEKEVHEVFEPLPVFKPLQFPSKPYTLDGEISGNFLRQLDALAFLDDELGWGCWTLPPFNLGSRQQIGRYLMHYGWKPLEFTETGQPKVSETILEGVDIPEAQLIAKYLMLQKRVGLVSSWIDSIDIKDERIHGSVNSCGAVTGRMTHTKPNLAQVPSSHSPYGKECRELFIVPKDYKLVGCDASGLELRMLAHYMNDSDYTKEILHGDIHTANQNAAGLESRDAAKTFIYAFLYGAGDEKIGSIVKGSREDGRLLKEHFLSNTPSLKSLRERITTESESGKIKGLDGRNLHIRSSHAALNTLLQSAGAIVMKKALVILDGYCKDYQIDYKFVGNIHDEIQTEVREDQADMFGQFAVASIVEAGRVFNLNCPLDAEYKIGNSWADTH